MKSLLPFVLGAIGVVLVVGSYASYQTKYTKLKKFVDDHNQYQRLQIGSMYGEKNVEAILVRGAKTDTGYHSLMSFDAPDASPYYFAAGVGVLLVISGIIIVGLRPSASAEQGSTKIERN